MPPPSAGLTASQGPKTSRKRKLSTTEQGIQKQRKKNPRADRKSTSASEPIPQTDRSQASKMSDAFGRNRLATGFAKPTTTVTGRNVKEELPQTHARSEFRRSGTGESADSAIELSSDEEMADSEGGIVLNVEDQQSKPVIVTIPDDEDPDDDHESGEVSDYEPSYNHVDAGSASSPIPDLHEPSFIIDPLPANAKKRLADLSAEKREEQIKYGLYHLSRDEIDLSRAVICLKCFGEGHLSEDCSQTSDFAPFRPASDRSSRLWISCCVCASKSHLIGDCPQVDRAEVLRWSLAEIDPSQIINLSLETGTRKLEKNAENRGMRPEGLLIKGRAGRHTAGFGRHQPEDESSDDDLLHLSRTQRANESQHVRYDRFDGPVQPPAGPRGGWYGTDSFGRRRSRSPPQEYHPSRDRRSPSPRHDTYRPDSDYRPLNSYRPLPPRPPAPQHPQRGGKRGGGNVQQPTPRGAGRPPPTTKKLPPPPIPKPNIQFDLPTRKGSGNWASESSAQSGASTPRKHNQDSTAKGKKANKKRNRASKPN